MQSNIHKKIVPWKTEYLPFTNNISSLGLFRPIIMFMGV